MCWPFETSILSLDRETKVNEVRIVPWSLYSRNFYVYIYTDSCNHCVWFLFWTNFIRLIYVSFSFRYFIYFSAVSPFCYCKVVFILTSETSTVGLSTLSLFWLDFYFTLFVKDFTFSFTRLIFMYTNPSTTMSCNCVSYRTISTTYSLYLSSYLKSS